MPESGCCREWLRVRNVAAHDLTDANRGYSQNSSTNKGGHEGATAHASQTYDEADYQAGKRIGQSIEFRNEIGAIMAVERFVPKE
jgi:hypothetical protein